MNAPIWEGVYRTFSEVPAKGPGFRGGRWRESCLRKSLDLRQRANGAKTISEIPSYRGSLLPVLAGLIYAGFGRVRIMDFGGGLGFNYYPVRYGLPQWDHLEFHVVEVEEVCRVGKDFFFGEPKIFFHPSLPEATLGFDIVCMESSLHYMEDWKGLLSRLCAYGPRYVLLSDLPAGDIPTYATAQNYYGSKIPVWFFNIEDILTEMDRNGFKLIFKSACIAAILGREQEMPQENFEEDYRVGYTCNLVFLKEGLE